ncbi:MAG: DUF2085 domain-containing protein [Anaerolineaceae bacterium]|nr:DUF2085 domain-containing protein [Anaerolineaceae bacterium]MDD4042242.1 DUF2085 domain-containing protein [Anaerolineaceae bacterium]MDD4578555.1 DUF2085 domain-containing protein [Anaerolineaceae bacterium]
MPAPGKDVLQPSQRAEERQNPEQSLSGKVGSWLKRHYLALINTALAIYIILPLMAPVLMKTGQTSAADVIYRMYKPLCHQLAYRSFFLFGEQAVFPREITGIEGLKTYEQATGLDSQDNLAAMAFRGNEQLGYKTALCQRDVAIYTSLLLFGLVFALTKRKLKPLPWFAWIILALGPMGLDGLSQLVSQMDIPAMSWFAMRESTPFLRVLTGAMFGWFTAWFGLPSIDEMINDTKMKPTATSASKED